MAHSAINEAEITEAGNRYGPTAARKSTAKGTRPASVTIDIHAHVAVPAAAAIADPHVDFMKIPLARFATPETRALNKAQDVARGVAITDINDRMAVLDAQGIDMQVVAPPPPQSYYHVDLPVALKATHAVNDGLSAWVSQRPDRFMAIGTVPLQDTATAVTELNRLMALPGMKGVQILTSVNGEELSNPRLEPFWDRAEELGAVVLLHPNGFTEGSRLTDHYFNNVIGNPFETTLALHRLIFDGVLERHPGLKVIAVHGGGYLPAYSGRIDHAWGARVDARAGLPLPPTTYLRRVYIDNVVFTSHQLEYMAKVHGEDRILLGSDFPYDMADYDPVEHIMGADLTDAQRGKIAGLNAAALFGVKV
jgi:aminocarboxymuconate-semialdehyde decarboxylase